MLKTSFVIITLDSTDSDSVLSSELQRATEALATNGAHVRALSMAATPHGLAVMFEIKRPSVR